MRITVDDVRALRFDDGTPVTAASAIAPLGDGWLVAQDDSTSAAWLRAGGVTAVRLLPPVEGHDRFSEAAGTKRLKPDLEVACPAEVDGQPAVLLLGSGSTARRTRGVLVRLDDGRPVVQAGELAPLHGLVARCLGLPDDQLNLEGASRHGGTVRWFNRGNLAAGVRPGSVDVPLAGLVDAVLGRTDPAAVPVEQPRVYDLGEVAGVGLAVTDAVALPSGRLLLGAAARTPRTPSTTGPWWPPRWCWSTGTPCWTSPRSRRWTGAYARSRGWPCAPSTATRCTCWPWWTTTTPPGRPRHWSCTPGWAEPRAGGGSRTRTPEGTRS